MARGLEAGSFLFGLEVEEEGGGRHDLVVVVFDVVVGGKEKKGRGGSIGLWGRQVFVRDG